LLLAECSTANPVAALAKKESSIGERILVKSTRDEDQVEDEPTGSGGVAEMGGGLLGD